MMTKKYVFTETARRIEDRFKSQGFKFVKSNGRILNNYAPSFGVEANKRQLGEVFHFVDHNK